MMEQQAYQTRKIVLAVLGVGLLVSGAQLLDQPNYYGIVMMGVGVIITLFQARRSTSRRRFHKRRHPSLNKNK
jgi:ribose/xylose/arabinose/galactoside ABC-type transport system permease subunit